MNLGAPELIILGLGLGGLIALAGVIWTVVDAAGQPDWAWQQAGQSKTTWIVLPIVGLVLCGALSLILVAVYFASIRPQVLRAQGRA
jgi:hypothetical protein